MNDPYRFTRPISCLITDGSLNTDISEGRVRFTLDTIRWAVSCGISIVQLREKQLSARLQFELAVRAAEIVKRSPTKLLISDRADIAVAAGADGVHLTSTSIRPSDVRSFAPAEFIIGTSTHTLDEVRDGAGDGADFAVYGPVFATPGKSEIKGIDRLRHVCAEVSPFPVLALGGIDRSNIDDVLEAGAAGFAGIRFMNDAVNLAFVGSRNSE